MFTIIAIILTVILLGASICIVFRLGEQSGICKYGYDEDEFEDNMFDVELFKEDCANDETEND